MQFLQKVKKPVLGKASSWGSFSLKVPLIAPVKANEAFCWKDSKLSWDDLLYA